MKTNNEKHVIPGMEQDKVDMMDAIFDLLVKCNFDLTEVNKDLDTLCTDCTDPNKIEWYNTQISTFKKLAKDMRDEAIRRGLIKE